MSVRHPRDYRALLWAFVLFPCVPLAGYFEPALIAWLWPVELYLAYSAGVLTHNHLHAPVFSSKPMNTFYSAWLSVFYGCPVAFWIPTHLQNHHRFVNGDGDATRTDRHGDRHDLGTALAYVLTSSRAQWPLIRAYVRRAWLRRGASFWSLCLQVTAIAVGHASLAGLAVSSHGLADGSWIYAATFGVPALIAPSLMMLTNYVQHVHCDPSSPRDHSRDFVSPLANWLVFENGYHGVHHEQPNTHWSEYPRLHATRSLGVHRELQVRSLAWFLIVNYLLPPLRSRFGTRPARRAAARHERSSVALGPTPPRDEPLEAA